MSASLCFPANDHVWDLREQIMIGQELAARLFAAENWVWAYKALSRIERMGRRLDDDDNPLAEAGRALLRGASPPSDQTGPAEPVREPRLQSAEAAHAELVATLGQINAARAEDNLSPLPFQSMLGLYELRCGSKLAASIAAVEARLNPPPTG